MKNFLKLSVFIFLLFCVGLGHSQTFEKIIRTVNDDIPSDAIETEDGFILIYNRGVYASVVEGGFLKVDQDGIILDSLFIDSPSGYNAFSFTDMYEATGSFYSIRSVKSLKDNDRQTNLYHISNELEILWDTIYGDPAFSEHVFGNSISHDNKVLTVGREEDSYSEIYLGEFDLNTHQYRYKTFSGFNSFLSSTIIDLQNTPYYDMYLYFDNDHNFLKINKQNLSIDSVIQYPVRFNPRNAIEGILDSTYFVAGTHSVLTHFVPSFLQVSYGGEIINHFQFETENDTNVYYTYNSFDHKYQKIYFAVTYNFAQEPPFPYYPQQEWILLYKLDAAGDIIWQHFYKGEVNYNPYKVLATNDGGALVLSTKYDWNDPLGQHLDLHLLKVDSTGWYDGLVNVDDDGRPLQILAYPNPVRDRVHFEPGLYNDLHLQLFDINGKLMAEHPLHERLTLDMTGYKPGVYVYVISNGKGFWEKGKLVKE